MVPEHLAERYQQIYVLTLGELILVTVLTLSDMPFSAGRIIAFGTAFVAAVLLWWSYARGAGARLSTAIERSPHRERLVQTDPYVHWLMVVGVVGVAAGFMRVIDDPTERPDDTMTALILGGAALFLVGRATTRSSDTSRARTWSASSPPSPSRRPPRTCRTWSWASAPPSSCWESRRRSSSDGSARTGLRPG